MQTLNGRRIHQSVSFQLYLVPCDFVLTFVLGNPCQLGLPIEQHQQGGHL